MTQHTAPDSHNLFADFPDQNTAEVFADLLRAPGVRIERIMSTGQSTPAGEWLVQGWTEWVALLSGAASLRFDGEADIRALTPGNWVTIAPDVRHRVEWTAPNEPTVWLAVHIGEPSSVP